MNIMDFIRSVDLLKLFSRFFFQKKIFYSAELLHDHKFYSLT